MPREIAWLCSLAGSQFFARLSPADREKIAHTLTQGTRTLRDFVPATPYGLN